MGKVFDAIDAKLAEWIGQQHIFFVATAPLSGDGLVNVSPKGYDSFRILDEHTVAYLDLTGSGVETISHLKENGRITIMFCAFEGGPKILRLQGKGEALELGSPGYEALIGNFEELSGARAIIKVNVTRIADSCGFAVPFMDYQGERDTLLKYADKEGPEGMVAYRQKINAVSLDGLPGFAGE
ncbi:MAG: pyridoxamine 5'-phosphate oxidase family protein [Puniceicoccales bacterium]